MVINGEIQDNEFLFSALGASPLRPVLAETPDPDANLDMVPIFQTKDGTLIDPITPKANALLFHYLRRASLADHQQFLDETTEHVSQVYPSTSSPLSNKCDSNGNSSGSTMSPPSISMTPSSSIAPPSLTFISDESSMIAQEGATTQGHSILMDFSPRIRKSMGNNNSVFSSPFHHDQSELLTHDQRTPTTPVNRFAEPDPMLTLSMERLSVRQSMEGNISPKVLEFSKICSTEVADDADGTSAESDNEIEDETTTTVNMAENASEFSLDRFPIVFQVTWILYYHRAARAPGNYSRSTICS